jgi:membrane associated rhomboid family serine protease
MGAYMTEFRPGRFQILPTIIKNLIIINVLVYLAQQLIHPPVFNFENTFALHSWESPLFKPWQMVTHMFMHDPANIFHLLFNMFALWMFGSILENLWGPKRFLTFYLISGLGAALCHLAVLHFENQPIINSYNAINPGSPYFFDDLRAFIQRYNMRDDGVLSLEYARVVLNDNINGSTVGASGAVFGCLAAFGYLFPNTYLYLIFPPIPIKAKWFVLGYTAIELYSTLNSSAGDNVAHVAHLGGALAGFLMVYFWNKRNRKTFY